MSRGSPQAVLDEIAALPRGDDLARLVHTVAFAAADERRATLGDGLAEVAERAGLKAEDAETPSGNALRALERGGEEAAGSGPRALLSALLARGVALSPPASAEAEARVAEALLWLAANTPVDALPALDAALGDKARGLYFAIAALIRKIDAGGAPALGRPGALVGAAALRESTIEAAAAEAYLLAAEVKDPVVKAVLGAAAAGEPAAGEEGAAAPGAPGLVLAGEVEGPPRGPVAVFFLGITGILPALHAARLVARVALRYRRPAEVRVSPRGVTVKSRTELIGRTLREHEVTIPRDGLLLAAREVRYPRLGVYAGLLALGLGSYFGVRFLVDGVLAGAPEYIAVAALLLAAGTGLDFVLEGGAGGARGKCRVVLVPRKGRPVAVGELDPAAADAALGRLKRA